MRDRPGQILALARMLKSSKHSGPGYAVPFLNSTSNTGVRSHDTQNSGGRAFASGYPKPETRNSKPETRNPKFRTLISNLGSRTPDPGAHVGVPFPSDTQTPATAFETRPDTRNSVGGARPRRSTRIPNPETRIPASPKRKSLEYPRSLPELEP